jgi:hypothetical protein
VLVNLPGGVAFSRFGKNELLHYNLCEERCWLPLNFCQFKTVLIGGSCLKVTPKKCFQAFFGSMTSKGRYFPQVCVQIIVDVPVAKWLVGSY